MAFEIAVGHREAHFVSTVVSFLDVVVCDIYVDLDVVGVGGAGGKHTDDVSALFGLALEVLGFLLEVGLVG